MDIEGYTPLPQDRHPEPIDAATMESFDAELAEITAKATRAIKLFWVGIGLGALLVIVGLSLSQLGWPFLAFFLPGLIILAYGRFGYNQIANWTKRRNLEASEKLVEHFRPFIEHERAVLYPVLEKKFGILLSREDSGLITAAPMLMGGAVRGLKEIPRKNREPLIRPSGSAYILDLSPEEMEWMLLGAGNPPATLRLREYDIDSVDEALTATGLEPTD